MKKIFALSIAAFTLLAFSSCRKYYTCTCTSVTGEVTPFDLGKQTEDDAAAECNAFSLQYTPPAVCDLEQQ
jgi:hypothetical protein